MEGSARVKIIVAGSRVVTLRQHVEYAISRGLQLLGASIGEYELVVGGAQGVDFLAETWAKTHKIPYRLFPANWTEHGKKAGYMRNVEMGEYADALIAVWDGSSRGTKHMIDIMHKMGKPIAVFPKG